MQTLPHASLHGFNATSRLLVGVDFQLLANEGAALLGRAASGALVGAAVFVSEGNRATTGAALGSTAAVVAAFAGEWIRALAVETTGLPDPAVALAEDATVLLVGLRSLRNVR